MHFLVLTVGVVLHFHLFVAEFLDVLNDAVDAIGQLGLLVQQDVDFNLQEVQ